jgi:hypothetical protein
VLASAEYKDEKPLPQPNAKMAGSYSEKGLEFWHSMISTLVSFPRNINIYLGTVGGMTGNVLVPLANSTTVLLKKGCLW